MGRKKIISILCAMAFAVVFAHSIIPHAHHCHETQRQHIHGFSNCEQLNTFIANESFRILDQTSDEVMPAEPLWLDCSASCERLAWKVFPNRSDGFHPTSCTRRGVDALRAPPVA